MNITKVIAAVALIGSASVGQAINVSSGPIMPGEWNADFAGGKAYAEAANIPMIVFWGSSGCSQCAKLKAALESDAFNAWMQEKKYVMIFEEAGTSGFPQAGDAKDFIKAIKSISEFPFIGVYWPKADGSVLRVAFTGRGSTMPVRSESELYANFIKSVETTLTGSSSYSGGGSSTPSASSGWEKAHTYKGFLTGGGTILNDFRGIMTVKTGKANKKKGTAKVTVKVELINGAKSSYTAVVPATDAPFQVSDKNGNTFVMTVKNGGFVAEGGGLYGYSGAFGGNLTPGPMTFFMFGEPLVYKTLPVVTSVLPKVVPFTVGDNGKKLIFESGTVKLENGVPTASGANGSGLKLTYNPKNGDFKGSFKLYTWKSADKLKKNTVKVNGYVFGGVGYGWTIDGCSIQLMR